jgi:hypothetical protein
MALSNNARLCDQIRIDTIYDANGTHDGTTPTMLDMKDYDACCVLVVPAATTADATHHITGFKVVSNTTAAGAGTDHDIAEAVTTDGGTTQTLTQADMGTSAPTTLHSQLMALDIRADQMYAGDRYIGAVLAATGTYTCNIVYIRYRGHNNYKDMFQTTRTAFQYDGDLS